MFTFTAIIVPTVDVRDVGQLVHGPIFGNVQPILLEVSMEYRECFCDLLAMLTESVGEVISLITTYFSSSSFLNMDQNKRFASGFFS